MNPLTQASPQAPAEGLTWPTSVTCSEDQSTAVPSVSPKQTAIAASSQATRGIAPEVPSSATRLGDCGVTAKTPTRSAAISNAPLHSDQRVTSAESSRPSTTTRMAPEKLPIEKQ